MAGAFFSKSWYLVTDLKVRLRSNTGLHRHCYRKNISYLIEDELSGQFHRITPQMYLLLGQMNGEQTVNEIWEWGCEHLEDDMPSQNELITVLHNLFRANVLHASDSPDIKALGRQILEQKKRTVLQKMKSPLGIKIPLWDPEKFLQKTFPWVKALLGVWGVLVWLAVVMAAILLASKNWEELTLNASDKVLSANNIIILLILYPLIKAVHELAHAYMVKRWQGEVHEIGVMLLVFFPIPYVDASAASGFRHKGSRMLVGAAGILMEVFIAALAMIFWTYSEPGIARAVAFNTMLIAGVSTILFNGNPLLRFDAYYVLSDYLEIPNLSSKANKYFAYILKKFLWRLPDQLSPAFSTSEATCLATYSILAFLYRIVIMGVIALYIAQTFFFIGVILASWVLLNTLVTPVVGGVWKVIRLNEFEGARLRVFVVGSVICFVTLGLVAIVPMPYATHAEGIIWAKEDASVHSGEAGFVEELMVEHNQRVKAGDVLLRLSNLELKAESLRLEALLREAQSQYQVSRALAMTDSAQVGINLEVLGFRQKELERVYEQQKQLDVRAHVDGRIVMPLVNTLLGQYLPRGEFLAHIVDDSETLAVALVDHDDIEPVRTDVQGVSVLLSSDVHNPIEASINRRMPASTYDLPSEVLTIRGGGRVARNPSTVDSLKSFEPYYRLELTLKGSSPILNQRVFVRIEHTPEPLAYRWYRDIRRLFLRQLDV